MKKEKGGERFENRVSNTLRIVALWCVYTSVVVPVTLLHYIHNIYERLPTKYM